MANERVVNPRLLVRVQVPERSRGVTESTRDHGSLGEGSSLPGIRDDQ